MSTEVIGRRPYINVGQRDRVYFDDLKMHHIGLDQFARALSHENRFGGQTCRPYSVAEHLLLCDWLYREDCAVSYGIYPVNSRARLALLMHDAHEALVKDMPSPHKAQLPDYRALEDRVERAVWQRFRIDELMTESKNFVKHYDLRALNTERVYFGFEPDGDADWPSLVNWPAADFDDFYKDVMCRGFGQAEHLRAALVWEREVYRLLEQMR